MPKGKLRRILGNIQCKTGMNLQICLSFILFALLISAILWVLEVVLLEKFYYSSKVKETQELAFTLEAAYGEEDFAMTLTGAALGTQTCISIVGANGYTIAYERDVMSYSCLLHGLHGNQYAIEAVQALITSGEESQTLLDYDEHIGSQTMLLITTMRDNDGEVLGYLLLNTMLDPITSTASILKDLLKIITIVLLLLACVISIFISRKLSIPIVRITERANRLAKGDYTTRFEGGSCKEVDELARSLSYAAHEISRVDTMQRDLVANVSHDLRTPLTMLKAYAEMIRDLSGNNPVKRQSHLKVIIEETDRLTELVGDILDLSKLQNGTLPLDKSEIDVTQWLEDIIRRYKGVSEKMGYHVHFYPDENSQILCDGAKMERVVCNLIHNAINYTGEDKNIYVSQINTEDGVRIEVRDTGAGIDQKDINRIFDQYYRSENHKREVKGTGLGLSIVKEILKLHGFHYGVYSRLGEGSVFWFQMTNNPQNRNTH